MKVSKLNKLQIEFLLKNNQFQAKLVVAYVNVWVYSNFNFCLKIFVVMDTFYINI